MSKLVRAISENGGMVVSILDSTEVVAQMGLARFADGRDITLYYAKGCAHCANTGYTGRISIIEMMPMSDSVRTLVMKHANAAELKAQAMKDGMLTMYEDGLRKAVAGLTTIAEVLRVSMGDHD